MPVLESSTYNPTFPFKNPHFNTVYRVFFSNPSVNFKRERLELDDGDFMDLDISSVNSSKLIIVIHGLEGSSESTYIKSLAALANSHNFDVLAMNLRGCSGVPNRILSSYHSGKTEDLNSVIQHVDGLNIYEEIHVVGYSLGGNLILKYLGEKNGTKTSKVKSAVVVSVPCDLKATSVRMNSFSNSLYLKRFLKSLQKKALHKLEKFPNSFLTKDAIMEIKNFKDFDNLYTAPAHGFRNAEDYWEQSSCKQYITAIETPTLLITALDDPFFTKECFPFKEAGATNSFFLETPKYGGHVGFGTNFSRKNNNWCERRILTFVRNQK